MISNTFLAQRLGAIAFFALILAAPAWGDHRIALFLPDDTPFWNRVALFAEAAAEDLDVELTTFDADANRLKLLDQLEAATSGDAAFDALLFPNFLKTAENFLARCAEVQIPCILFNSDISPALKAPDKLGAPRTNNQYWIGQLIPDDQGSSEAITRTLIQKARKQNMGPGLAIAAVNGYQSDGPAIKREEGLRRAVDAIPNASLKQVFYTDWGAEQAFIRTRGLLQRYRDTDIIWSANYRTTDGILRALHQAGLTPGGDVLVNSYDINPQALEQVADGLVTVTAGGHYVEGAWAVVLAHDYLEGEDFVDQGVVFPTPLLLVTQDDAARVRSVLERLETSPRTLFQVDFSQFSKAANPNLTQYRFSLKAVLLQYQREWALAP